MSAIDWSEIAMQCGPSIGSLPRGVLPISRFGFHVVFAPETERSRIEGELAPAQITIHGVARQSNANGEPIFVAVVKADSREHLFAIVHGKGSSTTIVFEK